MNSRATIAIMLCATVCAVILSSVVHLLFYPPGSATPEFRGKMFELLTYILGVVSGYLLNNQPTPPKS